MELMIIGKNLEVSDWLHEFVERKVERLDRYLADIDEARVELSVEKNKNTDRRQRAQVTLRRGSIVLRAEERSADMFQAVNAAMDKIQRQIDRYKGKRWERKPVRQPEIVEEVEEEPEARIVRTKRFEVYPMTPEEGIEQLELLGHDFFVFFNAEEDQINVLYRRKDGDYGLLQPDLA